MTRRLLIAGSGGAIAGSLPVTLTSQPSGGRTQLNGDPVYYNGVIYFGYVDGQTGNVELRTRAAGVTSAATVLHAALGRDVHHAPAIAILTDGRIAATYSAHNGAALYVWVSTNPEDISAGTETNIDASVGGTNYTYPVFIRVGSALRIYVRNSLAGVSHWGYTSSADETATWAAFEEVYSNPGENAYMRVGTDGTRVDFAVSSRNTLDATSKVGHFYDDGGTYRTSDGTAITGSRPYPFSKVTEVYDSADGPGWAMDLIYVSGAPAFTYEVEVAGDGSHRYAIWNGSAWVTSTILTSSGLSNPISCLDPVRPSQCHLLRLVAGKAELWRYTTFDNGISWSGAAITSGSTVDQWYPSKIIDHPAGEFGIMWLYGTAVDLESDFDFGIKAIAA